MSTVSVVEIRVATTDDSHVVSRGTALDLLPEQVDGEGRPAWVLPLGWSHAMLLLATQPELRLVEALRAEGNAGDGRGG